MKTRLLFLAVACCLLNLWAGAAQRGDARGPIYGRVTDDQGAPLPNVRVTLRAAPTGDGPSNLPRELTTTTADDGKYVFQGIPEGRYVLTFSLGRRSSIERSLIHRDEFLHSHPVPMFRGTSLHVRMGAGPTPTPTPRPTPTPTPRPSPTAPPHTTPTPTATPTPRPTLTPTVSPSPTPAPTATPQASPTPSETPQTKIDQLLAGMELGNIAFNVPPSMSLDKAETVVLLLSPQQAVAELEQRLREEGAVGDIKTARIKIHDRMQAVLSGDGFVITAVTAETLPVSRQEPTQWKWDVRAQRPGELKLNVVLNAIVDLDDGSGPRPYPIRTFSKTYVVRVSWREGAAAFLARNLHWLGLILLLSPAAAWLWLRDKRRRRAARRVFNAGREPGIFISYRRDDAAGHVGRLHDDLVEHFGADRVFMDIGSIGYGEDFVKAVDAAIGSSAVLIVVIGRQWLSAANRKGERRLDDPRDPVRREIVTALAGGVKIIPALVQGADMPAEDTLPPPLAELARRNAIEISDSRWRFDVERLVGALEEALSRGPEPRPAKDGAAG